MAKIEEWRRGFQAGALGLGIPAMLIIWGMCSLALYVSLSSRRIQTQTIETQKGTINQLQANLTKCQEISKSNYDVAIGAQEENRALRELVVQYQAQIQKGQAPAGLAQFLLKLLIP
jgi:hypothetical protein